MTRHSQISPTERDPVYEFLEFGVQNVFSHLQGEIDTKDKYFSNGEEKSPFEQANREVRRCLLEMRNEYYQRAGSDCKPFWLDRYVHGLFLDFKRLGTEMLTFRAKGEWPPYNQDNPSPLLLSSNLTLLAAARAYKELCEAGKEFDINTVIHGVGNLLRYTLYIYDQNRGKILGERLYLPQPQVPKNYNLIREWIELLVPPASPLQPETNA